MAVAWAALKKEVQRRNALETNPEAQAQAYTAGAAKALPSLYAPAYGAISAQVAPQFDQARNYLAANPYAARSGVATGLNRRILQGAFGQLGQSFGQTTANAAQGGLDIMGDLIRRRALARYQQQEDKRNNPSFLQKAAGVAGSLAPFL